MKQKIVALLQSVKNFLRRYKKLLIILFCSGLAVVIATVLVCSIVVDADKKYILPASSTQHIRIGLVLGAGVARNGKPYRELQARLDVAAKALETGQVEKLILSGDNRFENYNEPEAMKNYLTEVKHVDTSKLQPDYAGRSTYESCERATKVFGATEIVIYSAGSHLSRAIYLCRHFGIQAYGVSSGIEANNSTRRELLARVKAVLNVHFGGQHSILGPRIKV